MPLKTCFKCGIEQPLGDFYRHPQMADGHLGKCKECTKSDARINNRLTRRARSQYERKRYQTPERKRCVQKSMRLHRERYPERMLARQAIALAIRSGRVERGLCEVCGAKPTEAHHDDYAKPLDVRWLCFRHHRAEHGQVTT